MMGKMTDPYRGTDHPEWAPTLTEFLLARIAEDEAGHMPDALARPRVLAECVAKRRIIRFASPPHEDPIDRDNSERLLLILAAVYADHPDYHEEWKP